MFLSESVDLWTLISKTPQSDSLHPLLAWLFLASTSAKSRSNMYHAVMVQSNSFPDPHSNIKYSFSGHETFPFRYTWLPKGIRHLRGCPNLFLADDALVTLGVGKNMVRSIRHWCEATGVVERTDKKGNSRITEIGEKLLGSEGWDPYLEDPGTLWFLHWQLAKNPTRSSTWHLAFTRWNSERFTRDQLVDWLGRLAASEQPHTQATSASLRRDVEVFLRTYTPSKARRDLPSEDTFDCPLVELGLIKDSGDGVYEFARGSKPTLPDEVFLYALVDFWKSTAPEQGTLSFERILYGAGSPGGAFQLSENALAERLERLPGWAGFGYDDTAGLRVVLRKAKRLDPIRALERYYSGDVVKAGA